MLDGGRLFFIWYQMPGTSTGNWYLVQMDLNHKDDTWERFRQTGKARVIWQVREAVNSKKLPQSKCRYWPEIHLVKRNGDMGKMVQVRPKNVKN